jgi:valyl-tRNA synthetase
MWELTQKYEPQKYESDIYNFWEEKKYFHAEADEKKEPFTIVIPPPNVTGILHMGHTLNNTIQDLIMRWKKLEGYNTLWMPGTDHAGIATQNVVEKALAKEGKRKEDVGREKFLKLVWAWKEKHGGKIIEQLKKLGASCDWDRERFTMDEGLSRAVKEVFVRLYEKGLIYRGKYIINWCPRCETALADDEVEHEDKAGKLWHIKYPVKGEEGRFVTVATTRPETMLGDTAVAVHPEDERYKDLVGKMLILPLVGREIPVIADQHVDKEFGTGAVKVTPGHDPNDFEIGLRHNLKVIDVMDKNGIINEKGGKYKGLDRYAAREKVLEDLEKEGLLLKIEEHQHAVGHCYRCKTVIEPKVSLQWFVKMKPLAERAIQVAKEEKVKFYPARWTKVYYNWLENIRDWCISRQIWWGHRIPAYYCEECGEMVVSAEKVDSCPKCSSHKIKQDTDVLDTWFSSWLWPFSTLGWPEETPELKYFYPTDVLVTGADILFFWVARMIMAGLEFMDKEPFSKVFLHGIVRDEQGRKMSKSLGNSPDPIDLINTYGADALRFAFIYTTPLGQDVFYSEKLLEMGRNFANKVLNASKLVINFYTQHKDSLQGEIEFDAMDLWIKREFERTLQEVNSYLSDFHFNEAVRKLYSFFWDVFCKWYLELVKHRIYGNYSNKSGAVATLVEVLNKFLIMLHPVMPFLTELIYQNLTPQKESIMLENWPKMTFSKEELDREESYWFILDLITTVRTLRSELQVKPAEERVLQVVCGEEDYRKLSEHMDVILKLCRLSKVEKVETKPQPAASGVVGNVEIYLPMNQEEKQKEVERLEKEIQKREKELEKVQKKLSNQNFLQKAPAQVVEKQKQIFAELEQELKVLKANKERIALKEAENGLG